MNSKQKKPRATGARKSGASRRTRAAARTRSRRPATPHKRRGVRSNARRIALFLLGPFVLLLSMAVFLIWLRVAVTQRATQIAHLESRKSLLDEENNRLLIRAEQLADYGRIARIAQEHLGMVRLTPRLLVVTEGR